MDFRTKIISYNQTNPHYLPLQSKERQRKPPTCVSDRVTAFYCASGVFVEGSAYVNLRAVPILVQDLTLLIDIRPALLCSATRPLLGDLSIT